MLREPLHGLHSKVVCGGSGSAQYVAQVAASQACEQWRTTGRMPRRLVQEVARGPDDVAGFRTQSMRKEAHRWLSHVQRHRGNVDIETIDFTDGFPDGVSPLACASTPLFEWKRRERLEHSGKRARHLHSQFFEEPTTCGRNHVRSMIWAVSRVWSDRGNVWPMHLSADFADLPGPSAEWVRRNRTSRHLRPLFRLARNHGHTIGILILGCNTCNPDFDVKTA